MGLRDYMNKYAILFSLIAALSLSASCMGADELTPLISEVITEWETIKPGMTRAELYKVFGPEGGISTAKNRTFVYHGCGYIKVDVTFTLSKPDQDILDERPTDVISDISRPYLQWSIID